MILWAQQAKAEGDRTASDSELAGLGMTASCQKAELRHEKSEAILQGALQVFAEKGYTAASMSQIAIAAGVSKPTLYSYFKNKEGLFTALVHQVLTQAHQSISRLTTSHHLRSIQKVMHGEDILPLEHDLMIDGLVAQMMAV